MYRVVLEVSQLQADVDVIVVADGQAVGSGAEQMHLTLWPTCFQHLQHLLTTAHV